MVTEISRHFLSNQGSHASVSPETLEQMGKEASVMYLTKGLSLSEGIAKLAGAYPDFNAEQVKRVVEFANTATYLALHDKDKTAGAESSYPQFELADPARVIQDLSDGARPTTATRTDLDYSKLPEKKEKVSSANADAMMDELFKTASPGELNYSKESVINDVMAYKYTVESAVDLLKNSAEKFDMMYKQASIEYYDNVKQHLLEGGSFADVVVASRSMGADLDKIAEETRPIVVRLLTEKVASVAALKAGTDGIEKVAHRVVNEQHPLVTNFAAMLFAKEELDKVAMALDDTEDQLERLNEFVKELVRG